MIDPDHLATSRPGAMMAASEGPAPGSVRTRAEARRTRRRRWPVFAVAATVSAALGLFLVLGMTVGTSENSPIQGTAVQLLALILGGICLVAAVYLGYETSCRLRIPLRRSARPPAGEARSSSELAARAVIAGGLSRRRGE